MPWYDIWHWFEIYRIYTYTYIVSIFFCQMQTYLQVWKSLSIDDFILHALYWYGFWLHLSMITDNVIVTLRAIFFFGLKNIITELLCVIDLSIKQDCIDSVLILISYKNNWYVFHPTYTSSILTTFLYYR